MMGGVKTDLEGMSEIAGLFAAGEVACTGVHGANRLASNSLLEGLVFGYRAGIAAARYGAHLKADRASNKNEAVRGIMPDSPNLGEIRTTIRKTMWECVGIIRSEESLSAAKKRLEAFKGILDKDFSTRAGLEVKNMLTVALMISEAAIHRKGSVGGHYRSDFPLKDDQWKQHSNIRKSRDSMEVTWA
jgi:L-aspartate oxidase